MAIEPCPLFSDREQVDFRRSGALQKLAIAWNARARMLSRLQELDETTSAVLVQRQADLFPTTRLERCAASGRRLIYDVDDAVWLDTGSPGAHPLAFLKGTSRKAAWLASRADQVIAGNDMLAEWLSRHSDEVVVVPSLVDPEHTPMRRHSERGKVVLGWIGSSTTAPFLERLRRPLERLVPALAERDVVLRVVGGRAPDIAGVRVRAQPWSEDTELECLEDMDIGLMPLPDLPFTRGKCAYKALQYMAAGVPVVTDDVGITAQVVGQGSAGLVATGDDEWLDALLSLAENARLRARIGKAGRARADAEYSVQRWSPVLARALRGTG
ncbi:MAG: glycosyltransferase family 4 protein [Thermoleophilaceae bacterium]